MRALTDNKIVYMKKVLLTASCVLLGLSLSAQNFVWHRAAMDGSRTGVTASSADNVKETMGEINGGKYYAPNGKTFKKSSATYQVAKVMLDCQEDMADVKTVVAHSAKELTRERPEGGLTNWSADVLLAIAEKELGKKPDVSILNFGGIRTDMPSGDVMKDDIMSMFPFKNTVVSVDVKGSDLRALFEKMVSEGGFQVMGGIRAVIQGGELISCEVGGRQIQDEAVYNVATISFLLDGGDRLNLREPALKVYESERYIGELVLEYVMELEAQGKLIDADKDGRIRDLDRENGEMTTIEVKE